MGGQAAVFKDVKVIKDYFLGLWKCFKVKDVKQSEQLIVVSDLGLDPVLEGEMLQGSTFEIGIWMVD